MNVTEHDGTHRKTRPRAAMGYGNYLRIDNAERERLAGECDGSKIAENNITNTNTEQVGLLEQILDRNNMNLAYKKVKSNKGSHGIDKMSVEDLFQYLKQHGDEIKQSILEGKYKPNPVRRVEIPKEDGKKRPLGIPTVVDRVIQQSIAQVLSPIFEEQFSENSFGFRPHRSAHDAIKRCQENIDGGYKYVVDMDLEKYFDTVNHSKLIQILSKTIKDGRVISLIHKYLNAGVIVDNRYKNTDQGVPQGGPLSPLLSNIMLNELDKELERRGHRFVRYADDAMIFCKSRKSAERTLANIMPYITDKLFLRVNKDKTVVDYVGKVKFLGFSFYRSKGKARVRIHPKSKAKLKAKIKQLTARSNGWSDAGRIEKLKQFIRGWVNYFKIADIKTLLKDIDEWMRRRIRMVYWKQWKKIKTRHDMLEKYGIDEQKAWEYANTRKGFWRISKSPILNKSLTNSVLKGLGYMFFSEYYNSISRVN